jgi:hypothetical protein
MLNKIASNYLEKIAFWDTTKDIARNIPKGIADWGMITTEDTLIPAGRFGHKLGARVMSPFAAISSFWNKQYDSNPLRNYGKAMHSYIKGVDNWADKAYKDVAKGVQLDRQTIHNALPTTTAAGAFARQFSENATSAAVGYVLGGTSSTAAKAMATANGIKNKASRTVAKYGVEMLDRFGPDTVVEHGIPWLDRKVQKPLKPKITPTGEYLLGLYGEDNYVPKYF